MLNLMKQLVQGSKDLDICSTHDTERYIGNTEAMETPVSNCTSIRSPAPYSFFGTRRRISSSTPRGARKPLLCQFYEAQHLLRIYVHGKFIDIGT